ncbi:MAG: YlxR family protein [Anaerolinea sp.]|nr:YlxR family protein [Anaerolinea sp.]
MAKKKQGPRRQKHIPQRSCTACRQKFDKRRLTRLVQTADEGVVVDPTGKRNGRGAYLCDQPACWDKALHNISLLNSALHTEISEANKAAIAAHKPLASSGNTPA